MNQPGRHSCHLADFGYVKDRAVGVYAQDTAHIQDDAKAHRDATPGKFDKYDLDMGFKFASIPKILWLKMQQLGICDHTPAIIKFLQAHQEATGENYFTTTKRL